MICAASLLGGCADDFGGLEPRLSIAKLEAPPPFDPKTGSVILELVAEVAGRPAGCVSGCTLAAVFELEQGGGIPVRRLSAQKPLSASDRVPFQVSWDGRDETGHELRPDAFLALVTLRLFDPRGELLAEQSPARGLQLRHCSAKTGCVPVVGCASADAASERCTTAFTESDYVCELAGGFLAKPPITAWNFKGTGDKPPLRLPFALDEDDRYAPNAPAGGNPKNAENPLITATDLGSPFEHTAPSGERELVFLFGDTQPLPVSSYARDQNGKIFPTGSPFTQPPSSDDSIALSQQPDDDPPTGPERCIDLRFLAGGSDIDPVHQLPESELIEPVTLDGGRRFDTLKGTSSGPELGSSRVPGPGFSLDGRMFVLTPTSADPSVGISCDAAHPCPGGDLCAANGVCMYGDCSSGDGSTPCFKRNGPATLALAGPGAKLRSLLPSEVESPGVFDVYRQAADLVPPVAFHVPSPDRVYVWGRKGIVGHPHANGRVDLLFWQHELSQKRLAAPRFFAGCDDDPAECDSPRLSALESDAKPVYAEDRLTTNQTSVIWLPSFGRWVMIYGGRLPLWTAKYHPTVTAELALDLYAGIYLRSARHPWGPWSSAVTIYNPYWSNVAGYCELMFMTDGQRELLSERVDPSFVARSCDPQALVQADQSIPDEFGAEYGSAIVPRFVRDESDEATFYWLMSTWNPYRVVVMKTVLRKSAGPVE